MNSTGLQNLAVGQEGYVTQLKSAENMRRRLLDLGLIEGTRVKCLINGSNNQISAYLIRGAVIAIRQDDAKNIIITKSEGR